MSLGRDVVGKETIERQTEERQQYLPAAQRDVVGQDERDAVGAEAKLLERFAQQRPGGWKVGGNELVAAVAGIPVIPLGNLPMRQDPIARRIALDQHRARAIGDDVVDDLSRGAFGKDVRADAHHAIRLAMRAEMIGRQGDRRHQARATGLADAESRRTDKPGFEQQASGWIRESVERAPDRHAMTLGNRAGVDQQVHRIGIEGGFRHEPPQRLQRELVAGAVADVHAAKAEVLHHRRRAGEQAPDLELAERHERRRQHVRDRRQTD